MVGNAWNLQEAEAENGCDQKLLLSLQLEATNSWHGNHEDEEVGDDIHDGSEIPNSEAIDADGLLARNKGGNRYAGKADEDFLDDTPDAEEYEENQASCPGKPVLEDAAIL